ncbi:MAG TPA: hypothetical protein VGQ17_16700 [Gemmatimonadales bacterium]|nr:hypothetical protein [Gemmatimonadales bacterium]
MSSQSPIKQSAPGYDSEGATAKGAALASVHLEAGVEAASATSLPEQMAAYQDPSLAVAPAVVTAIVGWINAH